jgi:hypothetical protein
LLTPGFAILRTAGRPLRDHVFSLKSTLITTKAVRVSLLENDARVESLTVLSRFRTDFYACMTARADALFELTDGAPRSADVPDGGERPPIVPPS